MTYPQEGRRPLTKARLLRANIDWHRSLQADGQYDRNDERMQVAEHLLRVVNVGIRDGAEPGEVAPLVQNTVGGLLDNNRVSIAAAQFAVASLLSALDVAAGPGFADQMLDHYVSER